MNTLTNTIDSSNSVHLESIISERDSKSGQLIDNVRNVFLSSSTMQLFSDVFTLFLSYMLYNLLRFESGIFNYFYKPDIEQYLFINLIFTAYWLILFFFSGLYKNWFIRSPFDEIYTILRVTFIGCLIFSFFIYIDSNVSARLMFLLYFVILFLFVSSGRFTTRRIQRKLRIKKIISYPSLIIGSAKKSHKLLNEVVSHNGWGFSANCIVLLNKNERETWNQLNSGAVPNKNKDTKNIDIYDNVDFLPDIIDAYQPKDVLIAADNPDFNTLFNIASICSERNIGVKIQPDLYDIFTGQTRAMHLYGIPLIDISPLLLKPWEQFIKRTFDIIFSLFVICIGLPLMLLTSFLIIIESRVPIFYRQKRIGKDGKEFMIYKFRSMVADADKMNKWTQINDPRVTKIGKFLRKTHLDELPQFWNVLIGDMSIVGPRPEQPEFVSQFSKEIPFYRRRLKVRPGITGWWQVKYQPHILDKEEIENRLKDDFYYIENISLKLDIEIIVRTVWCVVTGHGQT